MKMKMKMKNNIHQQGGLRYFRFSIVLPLLGVFVISLGSLLNCTSGGVNGGDGGGDDPDKAFNTMIRSSAVFNQPEEILEPEVIDMDVEPANPNYMVMSSGADTRTYNCTTHEYKAAPGYNELFILNPTADVIYPGAIIRGESIPTGEYIPISNRRKPQAISISIIGANEQAAETTVDGYSLSRFRTARLPLLRSSNLEDIAPPANHVFTLNSVHSTKHFALSAALNIKGQATPSVAFGAGATFSLATGNDKQSYIAKFLHRFYTIDIDLPANPSDFFEELPEDLGVSPVYVSSVTYGRQIMLDVKNNRNSLEVQAGLTAAVDVGDRFHLDASLDIEYKNTLETSDVKGFVVGGANMACPAITDAVGLSTCITEGGGNYQDGLAIAYTLRHLRDNSVARVVLAANYTARQCKLTGLTSVPTPSTYQITKVVSSNNDENISNRALEISGQIWVSATTEGVGPKNRCGTAGMSNANYQRINVADRMEGQRLLFNVPGTLKVGKRDVGVGNYNFQATIDVPSNQNLSLCGIFTERDGGGRSDDHFSKWHVVDSGVMGGFQNIRFTEDGGRNMWIQIELQKTR